MKMLRGLPVPIAIGLLALALSLSPAPTSADPGVTTRVSVDSAGNQANGDSGGGTAVSGGDETAISSDGRFAAFRSAASNLVVGDTNGFVDIFVHDRQTGITTRVSVDSAGAQADNSSFGPAISSDGRFVAFWSNATNLVAGDTNNRADVFVHDRQTGATTRVSVDGAGAQANSASVSPDISSDGRFVAFISGASNLVAGDTNNTSDAFVHDRQTGATTRISVDSSGAQGNGGTPSTPAISSDGRFVAFISLASNLVAGDTNGVADVFVHDRQTGATSRVSVDSAGAQANSASDGIAISSDGRFVAFRSNASNLVAADTNGFVDIFVHDRQTGVTSRVSVDSAGAQANSASLDPAISSDGRFVAFYSHASNLVAGDTNVFADVFVHDRQTGATTRVSVDSAGAQANNSSFFPHISGDGTVVTFWSRASNLVAGDTNGFVDVFVHERPSVINVTIDIKPGSDPNSIKLGDTGSVPVAIFSTVTFDATSIDVASLQLNSASVRLVGGKKVLASIEDINDDGLADLVVKFDRGLLDLTLGDGIGTVTGSTLDAEPIQGTDSVRVIE